MTSNDADLRFHSIKIRNLLFTGLIGGDGPRLEALVDRHRVPQHIWFGSHATICVDRSCDWYVCKENLLERKIALTGFDRNDAVTLADEFGMTIQSLDEAGDRKGDFTKSPAWEGLKTWVAANPAWAAAYAGHDFHMKGWYEHVCADIGSACPMPR